MQAQMKVLRRAGQQKEKPAAFDKAALQLELARIAPVKSVVVYEVCQSCTVSGFGGRRKFRMGGLSDDLDSWKQFTFKFQKTLNGRHTYCLVQPF